MFLFYIENNPSLEQFLKKRGYRTSPQVTKQVTHVVVGRSIRPSKASRGLSLQTKSGVKFINEQELYGLIGIGPEMMSGVVAAAAATTTTTAAAAAGGEAATAAATTTAAAATATATAASTSIPAATPTPITTSSRSNLLHRTSKQSALIAGGIHIIRGNGGDGGGGGGAVADMLRRSPRQAQRKRTFFINEEKKEKVRSFELVIEDIRGGYAPLIRVYAAKQDLPSLHFPPPSTRAEPAVTGNGSPFVVTDYTTTSAPTPMKEEKLKNVKRRKIDKKKRDDEDDDNDDEEQQPLSDTSSYSSSSSSSSSSLSINDLIETERYALVRKRPGVCECCNERYSSYAEHLQSLNHRTFADNDANYHVIDKLLIEWQKENK